MKERVEQGLPSAEGDPQRDESRWGTQQRTWGPDPESDKSDLGARPEPGQTPQHSPALEPVGEPQEETGPSAEDVGADPQVPGPNRIGRQHEMELGDPKAAKPPAPVWQTRDEESPKAGATIRAVRPIAGRKVRIRSGLPGKGLSNPRQKIMTALIPVLAVALVILVRNPSGAPRPAQAENGPPVAATSPIADHVEIAWTVPPLYESGGRDPMRLTPPQTPGEETTVSPIEIQIELPVTGILYSRDKPAAIVDTRVVHEGQQVSGATVVKIEADSIEFEMNGRRWKQGVKR